jgi:predicted ferric reductase
VRKSGLFAVLVAVCLPAPWNWTLASQHDALAMFSQYIGSVALILMGISQLLATRWAGLETVFGGLDRIYVLHKWLGIGAIAAVLLHDAIDADVAGIGRETVLTDIAETLGEISLYGLLILVVLSIATFVPYHLWKYTHKVMGAFFAASALHYVFILKPFDLTDPVGIYVLAFCILGVVCYLYTLLPYGTLRARHAYRVSDIRETGDAFAVTLTPERKGIRHRPGQFTFVSFAAPGLREPHAFTISAAPRDGAVRFTIKKLGDYTSRLAKHLKVGDRAQLDGAYGHFQRRNHGGTDIWIAGGIGITPFAAFAETFQDCGSRPAHLFHCVRNAAAAAHRAELEELAQRDGNFSYHLIEGDKRSRLTVQEIVETVGEEAANLRVYFCGPEAMRKAMLEDFRRAGLRAAHFHYEEFEIRSGVGLRRLLGWLLPKLKPALATARSATASAEARD